MEKQPAIDYEFDGGIIIGYKVIGRTLGISAVLRYEDAGVLPFLTPASSP